VVKTFDWSPERNEQLITERGVSFEDAIFFLMNDGLLDDIEHPDPARYPNQRIFIVDIEGYAYLVPYVETNESIFLKTMIPSRKATRNYLGGAK
jgi:uncharacterized DUF497 family protein